MRAAAERGASISGAKAETLELIASDLRGQLRAGTESNLIVFLVDASGSMAARDRLSAVTGAVSSLLRDAYQRRDKVAVIAFRGNHAEVVVPATRSIDIAVRRLAQVRTGGRTPLAAGLHKAGELIAREAKKEPRRRAILVLLSDGRATGAQGLAQAQVAAQKLRQRELSGAIVIDCERSRISLGLAADLAHDLGAQCINLSDLSAEAVAGVVRAYHQGYVSRKA